MFGSNRGESQASGFFHIESRPLRIVNLSERLAHEHLQKLGSVKGIQMQENG